jgi:hypothetical protein
MAQGSSRERMLMKLKVRSMMSIWSLENGIKVFLLRKEERKR